MHNTTLAIRSLDARKLLRRLGVAGFTFFLVKGILWLVVPAALWALR
jgi:hypothetical protein